MLNKSVLKFVLGLKVRQLRLKRGKTPKELADDSGLSVSYLNEIEKGKKYPKVEKLMSLSSALDVSMEELVSFKMGRNLHPLLKFLESDLVKNLPLDVFGMADQDIYELMSHSPEKFANFIVTMLELSRHFDVQVSDLHKAALRSFLEMSDNYFGEIEEAAERTRRENELGGTSALDIDRLKKLLEEKFGYKVDEERLTQQPETEELRAVVKLGSPNLLLINKNLDPAQKAFVYGREIGNSVMGLKTGGETGTDAGFSNFTDLLNDLKASYFSGALAINGEQLAADLRELFSKEHFDTGFFMGLLEKYNVSTELFFHRLTQVIPHFFKLNQLFFLRCNYKYGTDVDKFTISKELHLSQLHNPHAIRLNEHYCRRWITIELLKNLAKNIQEKNDSSKLIGIQRSHMVDNGNEYFCFSVARPSKTKSGTISCLTMGILIDDNFKQQVKFWNDPALTTKETSQTCERCKVEDCKERVAPAILFEAEKKKSHRKRIVDELLRSI